LIYAKAAALLPRSEVREEWLRVLPDERLPGSSSSMTYEPSPLSFTLYISHIPGEFDLAFAAIPAMSYNFWQNLTLARAEMGKSTKEVAD
jgi:hypothetical protein